ncbi:MAG: S-adenosylmethionine decarboxylase proenzyme [Parcubacteria group bacterium GW2011_GWA2_40_37]|nr:MAG: S-adenosylmethionine decarboxylase proenzyme [Parcubacteria group bacterium GW2011_GWA2_40_37]
MPEEYKKLPKTIQFGEHVMIDGYGGNSELLNNQEVVSFVLSDLPKKLGMKTLSSPMVVSAPDNGIKDPGGWSGFVIIAESHISVHTFPKRRFISADVYSCKNNLDTKTIIAYFTDTFKLSDVETNFIKRGTRYPAENLI